MTTSEPVNHDDEPIMLDLAMLSRRERRQVKSMIRWNQRIDRYEARRAGPPPPRKLHRAVITVAMMVMSLLLLLLLLFG